MATNGELRVGCSGYEYDDWRGRFYPRGLAKARWFEHYAERFDTVEVNGTFYRLPEPETFDRWRERAPRGFRYALKLSRYGTHLKHLKDPDDWVGNFVERAERLRSALGPVLVQLPPRWAPDPDRLHAFLTVAPRRLRWAVEVRDRRWLCEPVYDVLREHDAALVVHDLLTAHPRVATAGWTYLRFHGPDAGRPYQGSYSHQALAGAARRIRRHLEAGRDVYAYFNNDVGAEAVGDAHDLRRYVTGVRVDAGSE